MISFAQGYLTSPFPVDLVFSNESATAAPYRLFRLLEWILDGIVLADDNLLLFLGRHMLDPHLPGHLPIEGADEAWVPQLRRDAQVLAAPHQRVALAALGRRRDAVRVEVLLFAARNRYESGTVLSAFHIVT